MKTLGLVAHTYKEHLLLPRFIEWHLKFFDYGVIINHNNKEDESILKIKSFLPNTWKVIQTKLPDFSAGPLDQEVMEVEAQLKSETNCDFIMALNITEWIFCKDFKKLISEYFNQNSTMEAVGLQSIVLIDKDLNLPIEYPLFKNHTYGYVDGGNVRRWRYIHKKPGHYQLGRHGINLPSSHITHIPLLYWMFAPWPQAYSRKIQIQDRRSDFDIKNKLGFEHDQTEASMWEYYNREKTRSYDLMGDPIFAKNYKELYETNPTI